MELAAVPDEVEPRARALAELIAALPPDLHDRSLAHASWVDSRPDSYGRLAFLGDGVLGLAVARHLFDAHPRADIGRLTKVHGQAVSGRACAEVARELGLPALVAERAPRDRDSAIGVEALLASERAVSSICEAVIGACHIHHGAEPTAAAVLEAFSDQIRLASEEMIDFKSALQERVARDGHRARYQVTNEDGPAHERMFEVAVLVAGEEAGRGAGRSKKAAEQAAAEVALAAIEAG
ncbi:ribonuclease III [Thermoleophilia bacterium SCSIO 60948]|nr:ribonuclease III [Thermoleophilia bacterium SCSIO 60948]